MSLTLLGEPLTPHVAKWTPGQRRVGSLLVLVVAALVLVVGLATTFAVGEMPALLWSLVGLLGVLFLLEAGIFVLGLRQERLAAARIPMADHEPQPHLGPAGPAAPSEAADHTAWMPPGQAAAAAGGSDGTGENHGNQITLRCGDCSTVFDVTDTGERPLYHTCPGCGAEGALHAPPAQVAYAPPAPVEEPEVETRLTTPALAPPPRRLKLRCGGCKEVFAIQDTHERPLRRPCPHCGRMGEIR